MDYCFTFAENEIRASVRKFARDAVLPHWREIEQSGHLPEAAMDKLKKLELVCIPFEEECGGAGFTFCALILAVMELAYASPVPANMVLENFILAWPVSRYGNPEMIKSFLPGLMGLQTTGALAFTEAGTGSDPQQLETTAQKTEHGWVLNGSKRFITHSKTCDAMILFAKTSPSQVGAFLVEPGQPGYRAGGRETFLHMAMDNGELYLENYFAPDNRLIGSPEQGFEILLTTEALGKIAFCAMYTGAARRAMDLAVEYAASRKHRGRSIGLKFQMIQQKLATMAVACESLEAFLIQTANRVDQGRDPVRAAAMLKLLTADNFRKIIADAMEIHGAYGLSTEYEISRFHAMAAAVPVVMGSMDIQRVITARPMTRGGA